MGGRVRARGGDVRRGGDVLLALRAVLVVALTVGTAGAAVAAGLDGGTDPSAPVHVTATVAPPAGDDGG